jgi:hypothetical protein
LACDFCLTIALQGYGSSPAEINPSFLGVLDEFRMERLAFHADSYGLPKGGELRCRYGAMAVGVVDESNAAECGSLVRR